MKRKNLGNIIKDEIKDLCDFPFLATLVVGVLAILFGHSDYSQQEQRTYYQTPEKYCVEMKKYKEEAKIEHEKIMKKWMDSYVKWPGGFIH